MAKLAQTSNSPPPSSLPSSLPPPPPHPPPTQYLSTLHPLPPSFRLHIIIHLEEGLYTQALTLLLATLTTTSHTPPPPLLALASTLAVHPAFTTRAPHSASHEQLGAADAALDLLRHVARLAGPLDVEYGRAFKFGLGGEVEARRRRAVERRWGVGSGADKEGEEGEEEGGGGEEEEREVLVDLEVAHAGSLFARAEDFWDVLGWAMNCAARYHARWARWGLWVRVMLDVLEGDWAERVRVSEGGKVEEGSVLEEGLIVQYLGTSGLAGRSGWRRVMRAVFANGDAKACREFGEIWKNETKERKVEAEHGRGVKRKKLDIDEGDFGDYARDEDDEDEVVVKDEYHGLRVSTRSSRQRSPVPAEAEEEDVDVAGVNMKEGNYGGWEAINIRRRLLVLLMHVAITLPTAFTTSLDLIDLYTEFLRPLPLPIFVSLISTASHTSNGFPAVEHSLLLRTLLRTMLFTSIPRSTEDGFLTQENIEQHYLPATANTSSLVDNAKVSLCVAYLLRLLDRYKPLERSARLKKMTLQGIEARKAKVASGVGGRKGKMGKEEMKEASAWLKSAESMLRGMT